MPIRLKPVNQRSARELKELQSFIRRYHSAPKSLMPNLAELKREDKKYFWAYASLSRKGNPALVGVSSYQKLTPFLAETQKTIVAPQHRGEGWGKEISKAIEAEVRRKGFRKIRTTIYATNLRMIAIKMAQGYQIEGYHPDHEAPGLHEYSLGKVLRGKSKR